MPLERFIAFRRRLVNASVATCDGVRSLTIDRESQRNALDPATLQEFEATFEEVAQDGVIRVIVLRGAGDRAFFEKREPRWTGR